MNPERVIEIKQGNRRIEAAGVDLTGSTFTDVSLSRAMFTDVKPSSSKSLTDGMTIDGIAVADRIATYRRITPFAAYGGDFGRVASEDCAWALGKARKGFRSERGRRLQPRGNCGRSTALDRLAH